MVVSSKASQESDDPLYIWESPILVVECLSPANRKGDVAELIADYRNAGVPEVWLLKPEEVTCVIYTGLSLSTVTTQDVGIVNLGQLAQVPMLMLWQAWAGE